MKYSTKNILLALTLFSMTAKISSAFAPLPSLTAMPASAFASAKLKPQDMQEPLAHDITSASTRKSATALSSGAPDVDLVVGFGIIAAASTPYVFGAFTNRLGFFLPIYAEDDSGRVAEIGWKVRYATLGIALTTLVFLEVYYHPENDVAKVLRDSYVLWAIFYTEATRKIRAEATSDSPILSEPSFGGRLGIQLWHLFVVLVLWADVSESYTGNAITNFIKDVFT